METAKVSAWWSALEFPRRIMLIALVLVFFSQHMEYQAAYDYTRHFGGWDIPETSPSVTGWQMHRGAFLVIVCLAVVYLTALCRKPFWSRWGYWASAVLFLFFCTSGETVATAGGRMGGLAILLALLAGVFNSLARRPAPIA